MPILPPKIQRLSVPGPTPIPESIALAPWSQPMAHRSSAFSELLQRIRQGMNQLLGNQGETVILSCSGTGAMEAVMTGLCRSGEEILTVNGGKFGQRWGAIGKKYHLHVQEIKTPFGEVITAEELTKQIKPKTRAVFVQGVETSTAVYHPIETLSTALKNQPDTLLVVDAISTVGVHPILMKEWGIDAVVTGSQKGLMLPPGVATVSLSEKAVQRLLPSPCYYLDLPKELKSQNDGTTAYTPAIQLYQMLDLALQRILAEGAVLYQRHTHLAEACRRGLTRGGLGLFAKKSPCNALTAFLVPEKMEAKAILNKLRDSYGLTASGGQDELQGKIVRLAHMGYFDTIDLLGMLGALELTLKQLGYSLPSGAMVAGAEEYLLA